MESTIRFIDTDELVSTVNPNRQKEDSVWYADSDVVDHFLNQDDPYWALRIWLEKDNDSACLFSNKDKVSYVLLKAIKSIDEKINNQVNKIIHHQSFKKIEASWRGLKYLINQCDSFDNERLCKIKILNLSWVELSRDINKAIEFDQSELFRLVYSNEFSMPGGEPFGLLIGDYQVSHKPSSGLLFNDIDTLKGVCQVSAAAFAPFITSACPSLFGVDYFSELAGVRDIQSQFTLPGYQNWQGLRQMEDARFLGLAIPYILMRQPYKQDGSRKEGFYFCEQINHPHDDYLWGNAAYGFAVVAMKAFSESGWFSQIRGMQPGRFNRGLVFDLPTVNFDISSKVKQCEAPADLQVGDRLERQLSDCGFMPLSIAPNTEHLIFFSNASVHQPQHYDSATANVNARISSMLQYVMCASRFAHYIKVMARDKVGLYETAGNIESDFQRWLLNYTTVTSDISEEMNAKYPLNEASIKVKEIHGKPGHYYSIVRLRPHFQLDQVVSSIRLVTELSPGVNFSE